MNSNDIFEALVEIAATPGKNDKVALVARHKDDPDFKRALVAALDPLLSYGVKKFLAPVAHGTGVFEDHTWGIITNLAARTLTGNLALTTINEEMARLSPGSAELMKRIILKKLDAGFGDSTVNKAIKGLIKEYPYMRCNLPKNMKLDEADFEWSKGAISQEKADGMFMNLDLEEGGYVRLTSRQGTEFPMGAFKQFILDVQATLKEGTQTHGEMIVLIDGVVAPREIGNGILNHVEAGGDFDEGQVPQFLAWDQIPLSAVVPKGKYTIGYKARLATLVKQLQAGFNDSVKLIPTKIVYSLKEAWAHYREMLKAGKEGTVFKKWNAIWKDGTSTEQGKLKLTAPFEMRVKGFKEGTGKFAGMLGSLECVSECGQLEASFSGRGDAMRAAVWADRPNWLNAIITGQGNMIMEPSEEGKKHSIFLPIFVERRNDKTKADTLDQIREQFEAAIAAA
ncbi:hypothetical protein LP414_28010 [Polaromonas sp. P1(28)-13]|nr:hypothetical protein LP414_28010 [Polaromonas sp. P1(28)-13]